MKNRSDCNSGLLRGENTTVAAGPSYVSLKSNGMSIFQIFQNPSGSFIQFQFDGIKVPTLMKVSSPELILELLACNPFGSSLKV